MLQIAAPTYELVNGTLVNAPCYLNDYSSEGEKNKSGANSMTTQVYCDICITALNKMQRLQHSVAQVVRVV